MTDYNEDAHLEEIAQQAREEWQAEIDEEAELDNEARERIFRDANAARVEP